MLQRHPFLIPLLWYSVFHHPSVHNTEREGSTSHSRAHIKSCSTLFKCMFKARGPYHCICIFPCDPEREQPVHFNSLFTRSTLGARWTTRQYNSVRLSGSGPRPGHIWATSGQESSVRGRNGLCRKRYYWGGACSTPESYMGYYGILSQEAGLCLTHQ